MKQTILTILLFLFVGIGIINAGEGTAQKVNIKVGGEIRSYCLYLPKDCQSGAPLVIAMHGASGSMDDQSPHFNEIADTAKFIIAYPQGRLIYFPVFGGSVTGWDASGEDNADAAFLRAIIDDLENKKFEKVKKYNISNDIIQFD